MWRIGSFLTLLRFLTLKKAFTIKNLNRPGWEQYPFGGATDSNNGVTEHYTYDEIESSSKTGDGPNEPIERKLFPGHAVCVTNNGSVGYAYLST